MSDVQKALNEIREAVTTIEKVADQIESLIEKVADQIDSLILFDALGNLEDGLYDLEAALENEEELEVSVG